MLKFILIGHPVAHSLSPVIHRAAYQALGLQAQYETVDCPSEDDVGRQIDAMRAGSIAGANVTVPWKRVALASADEAHETAQATGAANVLVRELRDGVPRVVAHNTDASALSRELGEGLQASSSPAAGLGPRAPSALILGGGGAALAATHACQALSFKRVLVTARSWQSGLPREAWRGARDFERLGAELIAWHEIERCFASPERANQIALLLQATSAGMHGVPGGDELAETVPWQSLSADTFAYDVVYTPAETPFLRCAKARGLAHRGGLGMLVEQARDAIALWLHRSPPRDELLSAALRALAAR